MESSSASPQRYQSFSANSIGAHLIQIDHLIFSYSGLKPQQASAWHLQLDHLAILSRTLYHLRGNNMAGKTTLFRILAGLEEVVFTTSTRATGLLTKNATFRIPGRNYLRTTNTVLLSINDRMFPELTIWENIRLARNRGSSMHDVEALDRVRMFMSEVPVLKAISYKSLLGDLSSGGQALIRLARGFAWKSRLLLIDEVTAHLDDEHAKTFFYLLGKLVLEDCSAILVSHVDRDHQFLSELSKQLNVNSVLLSIEGTRGKSWLTSAL